MNASGFSSRKKLSSSNCFNSFRKVVKDMADTVRGLITHDTLRDLSDEALDGVIANTQANQASLTKFYNRLINERVRRGLKLSDDRPL